MGTRIDWTRLQPADEEAAPRSDDARRALVATRLRAVHTPRGVDVAALAQTMDGLGLADAEPFADAVAEEDRGLAHFAAPLQRIAADPAAPRAFRALAAAALGVLEDGDSVDVLGGLLDDAETSRFAAVALVQLRSIEAARALHGALARTKGWAKADVILALLDLGAIELETTLLVEATRGLGPAIEAVAYPIAMRIGLDRALSGELGEEGRCAGVDLFSELLEQEADGRVATGRPLLMVGELVECMLDGLEGRAPGFREVRAATLVLAAGEVPTLDEDLQALVERVDVAAEVRAALDAGQPATAVALTRTFRSAPGATVLFDRLVMDEAAAPSARAVALRTAAELGEPRAGGVVRAALGHSNDVLRAAALDASRYLVPALGREALVTHVRSALATHRPLLTRAAIELARVVVDPALVDDLETARGVFPAEDRGSRAALDEAIALARAAATRPN